jgi:hypothetical protein
MENLAGVNRLIAALPLMVRRLFPSAIFPAQRTLLAVSEAAFWNLPSEEKPNSAAA